MYHILPLFLTYAVSRAAHTKQQVRSAKLWMTAIKTQRFEMKFVCAISQDEPTLQGILSMALTHTH